MKIGRGSVSLSAILLVLSPGIALAVEGAPATGFGVDKETIYTVTPWDAQPQDSAVEWSMTPDEGFRYLTSGNNFITFVRLPEGALLTSLEVEACDSSASGRVSVSLQELTLGGPPFELANYSSGQAATPGCVRQNVSILGATINNTGKSYRIIFFNTTSDGLTAAGPARIGYKLQVSPPPHVATFNDVPTTDPAYQFIEALASSGISAGCGGGNFCPDAPLTRRQMAVFLAKALGLQWPLPF